MSYPLAMPARQAAEYAGVSTPTVSRWRRRGWVRGRPGELYARADLDRVLALRAVWSRPVLPAPPDRVTGRCGLCADDLELGRLAVAIADSVALVACYPCLAGLLIRAGRVRPS